MSIECRMANTYTQLYVQVVFAVEARQCLIAREHKEELHKTKRFQRRKTILDCDDFAAFARFCKSERVPHSPLRCNWPPRVKAIFSLFAGDRRLSILSPQSRAVTATGL